jgi:hypothetical protein
MAGEREHGPDGQLGRIEIAGHHKGNMLKTDGLDDLLSVGHARDGRGHSLASATAMATPNARWDHDT